MPTYKPAGPKQRRRWWEAALAMLADVQENFRSADARLAELVVSEEVADDDRHAGYPAGPVLLGEDDHVDPTNIERFLVLVATEDEPVAIPVRTRRQLRGVIAGEVQEEDRGIWRVLDLGARREIEYTVRTVVKLR